MKILVIGGTGITGGLVCQMLRGSGLEVHSCSRHESNEPGHVVFDFSKSKAKSVEFLRGYDWVVCCVGPFEKWLDSIARLCVEAGTGYVDVNDSIDAREKILAVPAKDAGVVLMTGAGLCPGLSTALLLRLAQPGVTRVDSILRIGAGQPSGASSVRSMIETMYGGYRALRGGEQTTLAHEGREDGLVGYECPDLGSVKGIFADIRDYTYRVGFAALKKETLDALQSKRLYSLPLISTFLAKKASKSVTEKALAANDPKPATLSISAETSERRTTLTLTGMTSYRFTAFAAATTLKALIENPLPAGTYEFATAPQIAETVLARCLEEPGCTLVEDVRPLETRSV